MVYDSFVCELVTKAIATITKVKETDLLRYEGSDFDLKVRSIETHCHLQVGLSEV